MEGNGKRWWAWILAIILGIVFICGAGFLFHYFECDFSSVLLALILGAILGYIINIFVEWADLRDNEVINFGSLSPMVGLVVGVVMIQVAIHTQMNNFLDMLALKQYHSLIAVIVCYLTAAYSNVIPEFKQTKEKKYWWLLMPLLIVMVVLVLWLVLILVW